MTQKSLARRLLFLGAALLGALSVYIASKTEFDSDLLSVLPKDLPEVRGIQHYRSLILDRTDFMMVLKGEDPVEVEETAKAFFNEMMIQMPELAGKIAWKSPWDHPAELGDLTAYSRSFEDPKTFAAFTSMVTDPIAAQEKIDETLSELSAEIDPAAGQLGLIDPLGFKRPDLDISALSGIGFSTRDGKMRLITVDVPPEPGDIPELRKWDERLANSITEWEAKPDGVSIHRTGRAAYMVELEIGMKWELLGSLSFTAFAVLLLFFIFYGRLRPLFSLAIALCLTFLVTFAIAGLMYERLGILSVGFAAILIGLVVDYGVVV